MTIFRSKSSLLASLVVILTGCAITADPAPEGIGGGNYALDPAHASVVWRVSHLGFSFYSGRFDRIAGALSFDPDDVGAARVEVTIEAASVSTGDPNFDREIANKIFGADEHPEIRFASTSARRTGERTGEILGDLFFNGRTNPVTLNVEFVGSGTTPFSGGREIVGFTATATIDRTEWGAGAWSAFGVGEEAQLKIDVEFVQTAES